MIGYRAVGHMGGKGAPRRERMREEPMEFP